MPAPPVTTAILFSSLNNSNASRLSGGLIAYFSILDDHRGRPNAELPAIRPALFAPTTRVPSHKTSTNLQKTCVKGKRRVERGRLAGRDGGLGAQRSLGPAILAGSGKQSPRIVTASLHVQHQVT